MSPDRNPQPSRLYLWPQRDPPGGRPGRRVGGRGLQLRSTQGRLPGSGGADTLSPRQAARTRARTALEPESREAPRFGSFGQGGPGLMLSPPWRSARPGGLEADPLGGEQEARGRNSVGSVGVGPGSRGSSAATRALLPPRAQEVVRWIQGGGWKTLLPPGKPQSREGVFGRRLRSRAVGAKCCQDVPALRTGLRERLHSPSSDTSFLSKSSLPLGVAEHPNSWGIQGGQPIG